MPKVIDLPRIVGESTDILLLNLPVPPSVNAMYFNTRGGGKRLTSKAQHYTRDSRAIINASVEDQAWITKGKGIWLYADMVFYFPDRRVRDSHNCLKLLLDVMQGIVYQNDMYVLPRIQSVEYDQGNPRVEVKLYPQSELSRTECIKV